MKYFFSIMSMYTNFQCVQIINISERGEGRGSRDQEDRGLKSAQGNSLRDPISKTGKAKQTGSPLNSGEALRRKFKARQLGKSLSQKSIN
jgi:hypothetical protein